jgi:hypothetical protein
MNALIKTVLDALPSEIRQHKLALAEVRRVGLFIKQQIRTLGGPR